jgi:hypothetical protein
MRAKFTEKDTPTCNKFNEDLINFEFFTDTPIPCSCKISKKIQDQRKIRLNIVEEAGEIRCYKVNFKIPE